jgi:hypothetical protein
MHPKAVKFLKRIEKKYSCTKVVCVGDLVDWSSISYHEKDPSMPSASEEFAQAWKQVRQIHKAFPKVEFLIGNHDSLPARKAKLIGLPEEAIYDFKDLWQLKGWKVHPRYAKIYVDGVQYRHGDSGKGGLMAAHKNAQAEFCSVVQGHLHSQAGVVYHANEQSIVFGMQTGCLVVHDHPAMAYGKVYSNKPILGCGVVLGGTTAIFEPLKL